MCVPYCLNLKKSLCAILPLFLVTSCVTPYSYIAVSEPEEGGFSFTQITSTDEVVNGPAIGYTGTGVLTWWAPSLLAASPDSMNIAYIAMRNGETNIFYRKIGQGGGVTQRTYKTGISALTFSGDNQNIAFSCRSGSNSDIFMMNAYEGSAIQQITATDESEYGPVFSTDNKIIYFTRTETTYTYSGTTPIANTRYYVWGFDRETNLFTQYCEGYNPAVIPGSTDIIITRTNKTTNLSEIIVLNPTKGTETIIVSDQTRSFSSVNVHADGKKLICVGSTLATTERMANLDIYQINIDGTGLTQLTFHQGQDVSPIWHPNGKDIAFISMRGNEKGSYNVWIMNFK